MLYLFYTIIITELLTIIYNLIKFVILKVKGKSAITASIPLEKNFQINILIPCYKEINVIKNTLEHFHNITNSSENIDIYVITTEKENCENNHSQTTYDYLNSLEIIKCNNIHIINYPKHDGMMAEQLNYGINQILSNSKLEKNKIYFSIYNADSNPDDTTFTELSNKIINYNFPKILQQYSNYFLNYDKQNFILKGFAIYQTAFEIRNGLINNNVSKLLYSHVVGHGLTIRADYIMSLNGFNNNVWCEDIYLTGLLYNNSEQIIPLKSFDNAENPEKISIQINQNAVWFKTASNPFKSLLDIKKKFKVTKYGILWLLHELRASFIWLFMPIFLIYSFIYPITINNYKLLISSICTYLIFIFVNYLANLLIINKKRFTPYLKNYFSTVFAVLLTGIAPIKSFFLRKKIKTPRE